MLSSFGRKLKVSVSGGSHEPFISVAIDGLPKGQKVDMEKIQAFLSRRAPGNSLFSTSRREDDKVVIKSGLHKGFTFGPPLVAVIENTDIKPSDYNEFYDIPRPSHADYTARIKYKGALNMSGGGPFSGRMTAPLCVAGSIALQLLGNYDITVGAHILSVKDIKDEAFCAAGVSKEELLSLSGKSFPVISENAGLAMQEAILAAREAGDTLGGIAECCAINVPKGLGGPMYDGVESVLSPIFFGIPAVKGVEFGAGFGSASLKGSENNDGFYFDEKGEVKTKTNNHGGILGGITSGMPLIARVAFKPIPSISLKQESVNLKTGENAELTITGRHDACALPRAIPAVESAMALSLLDLILLDK